MKNSVNFITIKDLANRLLRHPLLQNTTLDNIIYYTIDFIHEHGIAEFFQRKSAVVEISNHRGELPCDFVSVEGVAYKGKYLVATTGLDNSRKSITHHYKLQGNFIFTDIENGEITIVYNAIPLDQDMLPMIPDNPLFLKALELYIKKEIFTILFDMAQIHGNVLTNTQKEYAWAVRVMNDEFNSLSTAELESICNTLNRLLPYKSSFVNGFSGLKDPEHYKYK